MTIAIEINGILFIGRWHKLAVAHRPCERTFQIERIVAFISRHQQEGFQFTREIFRTTRIVKRQRRQRIQNPRFTHHAAPASLYANNANDNFRRYAVDLPCTVQRIFILVPEGHTVLYVIRSDELFTIPQPCTVRSGWRLSRRRLAVHQTQYRVQTLGLRQDLLQLLAVKAVLVHHFLDELLRVRIIGKIAARLHDIVLWLKQEAAGWRTRSRLSL